MLMRLQCVGVGTHPDGVGVCEARLTGAVACQSHYLRLTKAPARCTTELPLSCLTAGATPCLQGLPTIRAYGVGERFRTAFLSDLTANGSWWFCFLVGGGSGQGGAG